MSLGRFGAGTAGSGPARPIAEINLTPFIDVLLVLLVLFIVAAPVLAQQIALRLPRAEPARLSGVAPLALRIQIDATPVLRWNGEPLDESAVPQRLREAASRQPQMELQLQADAQVPYARVFALIAAAQAAGITRVGFAAEPATAPPAPAR